MISDGARARQFTLRNNCHESVWPGIQPGAGRPIIQDGGFQLQPGQSVSFAVPTAWSGRVWARRGCSFDATGHGSCETGDCGGVLKCAGAGGVPPASLAEFTLDSPLDFYDVSLVDGYNLPLSIVPSSGSCEAVRCVNDLNRICPGSLQVKKGGRAVACMSACMAFGEPEYCCTGPFGTPNTCKPTSYSRMFKSACPKAYSYAYDDPTSTFTCQGTDYVISFC
ncbi:hypothetical protein ACLOJK_017369 [Asimina triloba]